MLRQASFLLAKPGQGRLARKSHNRVSSPGKLERKLPRSWPKRRRRSATIRISGQTARRNRRGGSALFLVALNSLFQPGQSDGARNSVVSAAAMLRTEMAFSRSA